MASMKESHLNVATRNKNMTNKTTTQPTTDNSIITPMKDAVLSGSVENFLTGGFKDTFSRQRKVADGKQLNYKSKSQQRSSTMRSNVTLKGKRMKGG